MIWTNAVDLPISSASNCEGHTTFNAHTHTEITLTLYMLIAGNDSSVMFFATANIVMMSFSMSFSRTW